MTYEEKTLSSEMLYTGKIINLRRDIVMTKGGRESAREIVEHNGGVVIVARTDDGMVPLVSQYRKAAEKVVLEIPAGKLEAGEDPREAALRELREETGFSARDIRWLTDAYSSIGYSTEVLHFYLATGLTPGETDFDEGEAIDVSLMSVDELRGMALRGEIEDQKTIMAILLLCAVMDAETETSFSLDTCFG
ncbi:MAG: NUDIX hydrolase [Clostridiales Family XIII bacterium]|jgi:ADP-ribose pyrophosphatase|nr:NUDIX hydrolase [Clostridiales Family XIII bacterium]